MAASLLTNYQYKINDPKALAIYKPNEIFKIGSSYYLKKGIKSRGGTTDLTKLNKQKVSINEPIDATNLSSDNSTTKKILGIDVPAGTVDSDIAGILEMYGQTSDEQKKYDELTNQLTTAMGSLGEQGTDLQAELEKQGVPQAYKQMQELTLKAAQLKGSLEAFDVETEKIKSTIDDQPIPTGLIQGQQAQLSKQRDLTRLSKAAELSSTVALQQAYSGNAQLGSELAKNAIDMKYQPILANLDTLKTQLSIAGEKLSKSDQQRATVINELLANKKQEIQEKKDKANAIEQVAIEAASNNAPTSIVNAIRNSPDLASAAKAAQEYLTSNIQYKRQREAEERDYKRGLEKEQRQLAQEKELIRARAGSEIAVAREKAKLDITTGATQSKLLQDLLGKKYAAAEQIGFSRQSKPDGGYDYFYQGKPINIEDYMRGTGMSIIDALQGSRAAQDVVQNLPDKAKATIATLSAAKSVIGQLQDAVNKAGLQKTALGAFTLGKAAKLNAKTFKTNPAMYNLLNVGQQFLSTLARASGEKGTLAEGDIQRAKAGIPQPDDTQANAKKKIENLQKFITDMENLTISTYGNVQVGGQQQAQTTDLSDLEDFLTY